MLISGINLASSLMMSVVVASRVQRCSPSGDHWEQLPQFAKDLAASNVDVILTFSCPAAIADGHLSINLKTAKALGIIVPASLIARADEVIE